MENRLIKLLSKENLILIDIEPQLSLKATAEKITTLFEGLNLTTTDIYDEFPAFEGNYNEYSFILLGIPDGGIDTLDREINNYQFEIVNRGEKPIDELINISKEFSEIFTEVTGIKSWPVE